VDSNIYIVKIIMCGAQARPRNENVGLLHCPKKRMARRLQQKVKKQKQTHHQRKKVQQQNMHT
jgi:hypothetical protein